MALWQPTAAASLSPSPEPDRIQHCSVTNNAQLSHSSMAVKRDNHCQPGLIQEYFSAQQTAKKSTTEPGVCQPPHPPRSHSASWHWEISHSLSSHALSLFPSPSSLEKKSLGQRPSLSVQSQALYGPDHNNKVYSRNNTNTEFYQPKPRVSQINS